MPFWPKSPVILSKGRCRVILAQRNFDLVARFMLRISMPFMFPFTLCPWGLCAADAMASPSAACSSPSSQNGEILRGALCNLQGLLAGGGWRWWCAALLQLRAPNVHMGTQTQAGEVRSSLQRFLNFSSGVAQSWLTCCRPVLPWLSRGAAHLLRLGAWARNRLRVLLASPCVLFIRLLHSGCKWQMVFVLWFQDLVGAFQPCSPVSFTNQSITSTSLYESENLADPLWFCLNRTNLWKGGLNWVITSSSYYHILAICQKSAAASPPVCSAPILWGSLSALISRARRAPLLVFVLPSISGI